MSRDAILELFRAPSLRLVACLLACATAIFYGGQAWASFGRLGTTVAQHAERIERLEKLRVVDTWNLYVICKSDNPDAGPDECVRPDRKE